MTQIQFNLDIDVLKESVMNSNIDAVVKSSIVLVLNEIMEKERDDYLKAAAYERSSERRDYRNGYYERELVISNGKISLRVPRTREGGFSPSVFEKFARVDQALILSMLEMVVNGVSTRKVTNIVEQLCGESMSKSFVSSLTEKLDPIVNKWASRPLNVHYFPYLYADAMYIKVREHHKVVSKAVYIMTAMNEAKKREVIGLKIDHVESFESWQSFFQDLKSRGLQSPRLVISDAHAGLKKAIEREFIGTSWQRCTVHFKRNFIEKLPKKDMGQVIADMRRIYQSISPKEATKYKDEFNSRYEGNPKIKKAIEILDEGFQDSIQYLNEPEEYQRNITSTNSLERLNQEIRRRERVIRIFPNTQSAFRLIGAFLMENENLELNKRKR
ncbi:IS256 family transposase [Halalkalibacter okhensis]|uniref:Mutator family transposase n=1 Tax=Halalkalibacter okhensis TaxID=333138 RepID=A0A0B0IGW4_9BACI|nr:IS256 family transposase [Halalkalibacter okhensis]KHF40127.1 transposase [Halalkalibacter okhensis]